MTALFRREFDTLARLEHPSIVRVYDTGVGEQGFSYPMELVSGDDHLARRLDAQAGCGPVLQEDATQAGAYGQPSGRDDQQGRQAARRKRHDAAELDSCGRCEGALELVTITELSGASRHSPPLSPCVLAGTATRLPTI